VKMCRCLGGGLDGIGGGDGLDGENCEGVKELRC
jgi:hypothetical protein